MPKKIYILACIHAKAHLTVYSRYTHIYTLCLGITSANEAPIVGEDDNMAARDVRRSIDADLRSVSESLDVRTSYRYITYYLLLLHRSLRTLHDGRFHLRPPLRIRSLYILSTLLDSCNQLLLRVLGQVDTLQGQRICTQV